jgi:hypothetical protein
MECLKPRSHSLMGEVATIANVKKLSWLSTERTQKTVKISKLQQEVQAVNSENTRHTICEGNLQWKCQTVSCTQVRLTAIQLNKGPLPKKIQFSVSLVCNIRLCYKFIKIHIED